MAWRQGRLQNGDALVFGHIKTLVSFSLVWYVCVVAGHMVMVWQGSCKVRCVRRKSREASAEGFATEKISSACYCLTMTRGEVVGVKVLDLYIEGKYETIRCIMYSGRQSVFMSFILSSGVMVSRKPNRVICVG
jgi:hypothetical protein